MRYSTRESVTATTDGTCRAGLVTVSVTPGSTAPLSSVTCPSMPAPSWPAPALAGRANSIRQRIAAAQPIVLLERSNHRSVIFSPSDIARDKRAAVMRHIRGGSRLAQACRVIVTGARCATMDLHHGLYSCVGVYAAEHWFQRP